MTIIGAGVSGIFLAYSLAERNKKILLIEKGKPLDKRSCPLDIGESCHCDVCDKYFGFGGLGKSEGKFNYTNGFGGQLEEKVGSAIFQQLMAEVDQILCRFGGDQVEMYSTENHDLVHKAKSCGLEVLTTDVRHLGTKLSTDIFQSLYDSLKSKIDMMFQTEVRQITNEGNDFRLQIDNRIIRSKQVVIATGKSGNDWFVARCKALGITQDVTRVDLGIRIEMRGDQLDSILQESFETKLRYVGKDYVATTYCMNPRGRIIRKYQDGLVMPDGQNYRERTTGSANLNFTLFVPRYYRSIVEAEQYAHSIISKINKGRDRIVVQRLGDLKENRATPPQTIANNRIQPTLLGECGDLRQEIPSLYVRACLEFFSALEDLIGESIDPDTLLYGIDGKFYAPTIETTKEFETCLRGLYVIGDCSGVTHSLSQAAASGIYLGKVLGNL